jgi:hypothetical protein
MLHCNCLLITIKDYMIPGLTLGIIGPELLQVLHMLANRYKETQMVGGGTGVKSSTNTG